MCALRWPSGIHNSLPPFCKRAGLSLAPGLVAFHRHEVVAITRFEKAIDTLDAVTWSDHQHILLGPHLLELFEDERYRGDAVSLPAFAQELPLSCLLVGVDRCDLCVYFAKEPR